MHEEDVEADYGFPPNLSYPLTLKRSYRSMDEVMNL